MEDGAGPGGGATGLAGSALESFNKTFDNVARNLGSTDVAASLSRSLPISKLSSVTKVNDMISDDISVGQLFSKGYITEDTAVSAIKDPTGSQSMSIIKRYSDLNPGPTVKKKVLLPTIPVGTKNQTISRTIEAFQVYTSLDRLQEEGKVKYKLTPEPLVYVWKSPKGSSIEIDDTGYNNTGLEDGQLNKKDQKQQQIPDNRGIRLTTKQGQLVHLLDEAGYESILIRDFKNNYLQFDTVSNNCFLNVNNDLSEKIFGNVKTTIGINCNIDIGKILTINTKDKIIVNSEKGISISSETYDLKTKKTINITSGETADFHGEKVANLTGQKVTVGGSTITTLGLDCATNALGSSASSVTAVTGSKVGIEFELTGVPTAGFESKPTLPEIWLKTYIATTSGGSITMTPIAIRAVRLPGGTITVPLT